MKVNDNFILREIADEHLLIPVGEAAQRVRGLIALSESGGLLYQKIQEGCSKEELVQALLETYEVDAETARRDVEEFWERLAGFSILLEG